MSYIERALGITLKSVVPAMGEVSTGTGEPLTLEHLQQMVADGKCEWQDPSSFDCGNNDGHHYIYLPANEELDEAELFIAINLNTQYLMYT